MKYKFVGVEYWGSGDKNLSDFKKMFSRKIPPSEMEEAFKYIKAEYKKLYPSKVKEGKASKSEKADK